MLFILSNLNAQLHTAEQLMHFLPCYDAICHYKLAQAHPSSLYIAGLQSTQNVMYFINCVSKSTHTLQ